MAVITAPNDNGSVLDGTSGDDTLFASHGADTLTGGAGSDVFKFTVAPWSSGEVTDFTPGQDRLDISAILHSDGYSGTDPIADGWLYLTDDGHGGTQVAIDQDGPGTVCGWVDVITDLDGVAPSSLQLDRDVSFAWTQPSTAGPAGSNGPGQTIAAPNDSGSALTGTAGDDTLVASHAGDTLTGGAGADVFKLPYMPNSPVHITDFTPGTDHLDLTALTPGYTGTDPLDDGYLNFGPDGSGGTLVWIDPDGPGPAYAAVVVDLEGTGWSTLKLGQDIWIGGDTGGGAGSTSASTTGSGGSTGDTGSGSGGTSAGSTGGASGGTGGSTGGSTGASTGSAGGSAGQTLAAPDDSGSTLTGGSGDDTLVASHGADTLTGGAGADTFEFPVLPWSAGHVTDFTPGTDVLDLKPLVQAAGYTGSDPVADGYLSFSDDGAGDTQVFFNPHDGSNGGWPYLITTLDHVSPSSLVAGRDWVFS